MAFSALGSFRIVDFSREIAGSYATRLFADGGAEVIKVENPAGDPLRRWSASGQRPEGQDGALFRFLAAGKRSVVGEPQDPAVAQLVAGADLVVEDFGPDAPIDRAALREEQPQLVLLSISPFGLEGPWARRPATEFIVQAEAGSLSVRGLHDQEPFQAGARTTEWIAGTFASVPALAAMQAARRSGYGEHIDFSMQEAMSLAGSTYLDLMWGLLGRPPVTGAMQSVETPSIHRTKDGFVGVNTNTQQQIADFLIVIERPDLIESGEYNQIGDRIARFDEWEAIVNAWTREHTTAEIVEKCALFRVPVAPVSNGRTVLEHEQLVARGVYREDPSGGFMVPRPPYLVDDEEPARPRPAPALGEHTETIVPRERPAPRGEPRKSLPLEGLRVVDLSNWWAGPASAHFLACLGADVIHVESTRRPDGARMIGGMFAGQHAEWWECSTIFLSTNTNKRGLSLNLNEDAGREALWKLIDTGDVVIENFSPRVMEGFGFTREAIRERKPDAVYARMPAFGLDGPWRDHVGFAQTMEQLSGLAWLTGHAEDQPRIQRGTCDPLAGVHAAFAILAALERRAADGRGAFLECTMVEGALNVAAEQVIEYTAYGHLMEREGNRSPAAAPQGLYATLGHDTMQDPRWLALSVEQIGQWDALIDWLGNPEWARDLRGASLEQRREAQDRIDEHLRTIFGARDRDEVAAELQARGIPAAALADHRALASHPQMVFRDTYQAVEHPVVGEQQFISMPFRFVDGASWIRFPAPLLGQHNGEILHELGYDAGAIEELAANGIIGTKPDGL